MIDDLRTRIAALLYERHYRLDGHPDLTFADLEVQIRDVYLGDADAVIEALPELQPCPFCQLTHNRCDCLRAGQSTPRLKQWRPVTTDF